VTRNVRTWPPLLRIVALVLAVAAVPVPALAGDDERPAPRPSPIAATAEKVAANADLATAQGQAPAAEGSKVPLDSPSFFRTPVGIAVLAVIGAGAGFAIYSAKNDRIKSPAR
jgi:hypothetical protein